MTSPDQRLDRVNPSRTVHNIPPEVPQVRRLTSKQVGVIGTTIVDLILAQVALALGGIDILGFKPFEFLTVWGQEVQRRAADAFNQSIAAEAVANSADANQAIALAQVDATQADLQETQTGLQTTWNGLWEASNGVTLSPGVNKSAGDVKTAQAVVRGIGDTNTGNIQGTWDNIWAGAYNETVSGKPLTSVRTATGAIVTIGNTAAQNADTANGSIQNTWNQIYVATGGTATGNRSLQDARDSLAGLNDNVYLSWEAYYLNWYGYLPPEPTVGDVGDVTKEISETVTDLDNRVGEIETDKGAGVFGGNGISVSFNDYATGALPNPPWTVSYPSISGGFGSNTVTVNDQKQVVFTSGGNMKRRGVAIYNATQLRTTFHKVSVSLAGWPQQGASNWIYARSNSTGTTAIAARIYVNTFLFFFNTSHTVELYSISGGVATPFASTTTALAKSTSTWTLECGTTESGNGPSTFRVLCDGRQVISDTTNLSAANGGNYVGFGIESLNGLIGYLPPAAVSSFNAYDNIPATYLGAGYKAARSTTSAYALPSAPDMAVVPAAAFNSDVVPATNTITKNSASSVTVSVEGWYAVTVSLCIQNALNTRCGVYVGGDLYAIGPLLQESMMTFLVYAEANETIQPAYYNGAGFDLSLIGDGGGYKTYWSVTFLGNTMPKNPTK